jgi:hypothetical protein
MVMKILSHKHVKEHGFSEYYIIETPRWDARPLGFLSPFDPHMLNKSKESNNEE